MKTIKQIAEEIGVSKQAVNERMKREPLCVLLGTSLSKIGNTIHIDEAGEKLIKQTFGKMQTTSKSTTKTPSVYTVFDSEMIKAVNVLTEQMAELTKTLKTKNIKRMKLEKKKVRLQDRESTSKSNPYNRAYKRLQDEIT